MKSVLIHSEISFKAVFTVTAPGFSTLSKSMRTSFETEQQHRMWGRNSRRKGEEKRREERRGEENRTEERTQGCEERTLGARYQVWPH